MYIYEVSNLDCKKKTNKKKLVKMFREELKIEGKLDAERVGRICKKVEDKYVIPMRIHSSTEGKLQVSLEIKQGTFHVFVVNSVLEAYMKYCLFVKIFIKRKLV